jgi:beta-barrel assembly-enhancing protease
MANDNQLPDLGASALSTLTIEKEQRLGAIIFEQVRGQASVVQDPLIDEYLNSLGNRLVANAEDVKFPFTFFAVNSEQINAFAFYGGHIGLHTGLISTADTESQLASVFAHEIAHITQRHSARSKEAANNRGPMTLASIVGSLLLAAINPQAMVAAMMASTAGSAQASINFTRGNEQEADNIGMNILAESGFDPHAAGEFFEKLQAERRYKTQIPAFLVTHPMPDSRVTDARLRAMQYERKFFPDSLDFLLIKARINARYSHSKRFSFEDLKNRVEKASGNRKFSLQYELLLRLVDGEKLSEATILWRELNETAPANLFLLDTYTDLSIASQQASEALAALKQAYQLKPNNSVVTLNYANAAMAAGQPDKAISLLEYFLLVKPNNIIALQLLSSAYKQEGNMAKYYNTRARTLALMARYSEAIGLIDRAMALLGNDDNTEISRMQALKVQYRNRQNYIKDIKGSF